MTLSSTEITCATLNDDDHAAIAEAAGILLDARGVVIRISEWVGGQVRGVSRRLAELSGQARYQAVVEAALRNAYRVGTLGLDKTTRRAPRRRLTRLMAAATGGASGFAGLPGIAADLPVTTCLMMRTIAEIARAHGEDLSTAETREACIEVFAFGGPELADEDIDIAYWTIRGSLSHASISLLIGQVAGRFGLMLSQKYLAQAVPVIGAAAGTTLNYVFMDYYQKMAQVHFTLRALERRHNPANVRACFDRVLARERERRAHRPAVRSLPQAAGMLEHALPNNRERTWIGRSNTESSTPAT